MDNADWYYADPLPRVLYHDIGDDSEAESSTREFILPGRYRFMQTPSLCLIRVLRTRHDN